MRQPMKRLRRGLTQGSTPTPGTAQSLPGCDSSSPALPLCLSLFFPHIKLQCCSLCWHCSHIQVTRSWSPSLFVFSIVFFFFFFPFHQGSLWEHLYSSSCSLFLLSGCMVMVNIQPQRVYEPCGLPGNSPCRKQAPVTIP